MSGVRPLPAALLAVLLAGCASFNQRAPQIGDYSLAYSPPAMSGAQLPVVLGVSPLRVAAPYDRELIVYREGEYATGTYFYSRWSANPGTMIADLLARDFAASGLYRAVQRGPGLLSIDYQLTGEIEEIEERMTTDGSCRARLRLRVVLLRVRGGTQPVALGKTYSGDEPCRCDANALAAAMSQIMEQMSGELQHDVYDAVAAKTSSGQSSVTSDR